MSEESPKPDPVELTHAPTILSVNVGLPRTVDYRGTRVSTAIYKQPVDGRIAQPVEREAE